MRNPLRTEADAFRFLGVVIVGAALIVGASRLNVWAGLGVAVLAVSALAWWYWRQPSPGRPAVTVRPSDDAIHRILVIANETVGGRTLSEELIRRSGGRNVEILVVAPALNSPLRHWTSDEDKAREAARERVEASVARLSETGLSVRGEIGDGEPLQALEDALRTFGADEIVISTHPVGRSHWLEQGLVEEARKRFPCPITHVIVDLEAERLAHS
jgi:hypothetical protein